MMKKRDTCICAGVLLLGLLVLPFLPWKKW